MSIIISGSTGNESSDHAAGIENRKEEEQFLLVEDHQVFDFLTGKDISTYLVAIMASARDRPQMDQRLSNFIVRTRDRCARFLEGILSAEELLDFWNHQSNALLLRMETTSAGHLVQPISEWCALYDYIELSSRWKGRVPLQVDDESTQRSWPVAVGTERDALVLLSTPFWTKEVLLLADAWVNEEMVTRARDSIFVLLRSYRHFMPLFCRAGNRIAILSSSQAITSNLIFSPEDGLMSYPDESFGVPLLLVPKCTRDMFGEPTLPQPHHEQHEWLLRSTRENDGNMLCFWGLPNCRLPSEEEVQEKLMDLIIQINKRVDAEWQG